jgi:hypothetical protein
VRGNEGWFGTPCRLKLSVALLAVALGKFAADQQACVLVAE